LIARADVPRLIDWGRERAALAAFMAGMPFRLDLDRGTSARAITRFSAPVSEGTRVKCW
jgi:hypothetical protein